MTHEHEEPRHPIRVVAQRAGLTPATLRAWERRYGVVTPVRSEGGQRLYSDHDVERLARLRLLTDAGRSISMVAELSDEEAEALLEEDVASRRTGSPTGLGASRAAPEIVQSAFARTLAMDGEGLEACLRRGAIVLGAHPFLEEVVGPLLHRVGVAWTRGELGPAHEHLCTATTERVLRWLTEPARAPGTGGRIVVATLPGERHGLGAMLVAAAAGLEGWQVTDLGVDLPPADIAAAATEVGARLVALSLVAADGTRATLDQLSELRRGLPDGTGIVLGGAGAARLAAAVLPEDVTVVGTLAGLRELLAERA